MDNEINFQEFENELDRLENKSISDKLLKIIKNFIEKTDIVTKTDFYKKPEKSEFINYSTYTSTHKLISFVKLYVNSNEQNLYRYYIKFPNGFKEKRGENRLPERTIKFFFNDEPPILVYNYYVDVKKEEIVQVRKKTYLNFFPFKSKKQPATLSYTEDIPKYVIKCGPIKVFIDEQTFDEIYKQVLDKEKILNNLEIEKEIDTTRQIIDARFKQIN